MIRCPICKKWYERLHNHHVFFGTGDREISDLFPECQISICYECHEGTNGVHGKNGRNLDLKLKREAQARFVAKHGHTKFMQLFGRNYMNDDTENEVEQIEI